MGLPEHLLGLGSTDLHCYRMMQAWKANEHIGISISAHSCQTCLKRNSEDEAYIKRKCRERINMAGKYILLIGEDTRFKYKYALGG